MKENKEEKIEEVKEEKTNKKEKKEEFVRGTEYYIVKIDDTLKSIAKKYKTTVDKLKELNNISDDNDIFAGNQLKVK